MWGNCSGDGYGIDPDTLRCYTVEALKKMCTIAVYGKRKEELIAALSNRLQVQDPWSLLVL